MPLATTRADALRVYWSGASSDGAAQSDPTASLGGFRSGDGWPGMGYVVDSPMPPLRVDYASPAMSAGEATIEATGASTVRLTAPGGSAGEAATIADGQTRILEDGNNPGQYVRVTRKGTADLSGTMALQIADPLHFIFDEVTEAERSAGVVEYRALFFKNESGHDARDVKAWVNSGAIRLGWEAPGSQTTGAVQTIASETTAPNAAAFDGGAWDSAAGKGNAIQPNGGVVEAGWIYALWLERTISAGASGAAETRIDIGIEATTKAA